MPTLLEAAKWCDEEYRRLAMRPYRGESSAQYQTEGSMATLAETAALLRSWAATGREPAHAPVRERWRFDFEKSFHTEEY